MNADELAKQYEESRQAQATAKTIEKEIGVKKSLDQFQQNVKTWMGEYLNQFDSDNIVIEDRGDRVQFKQPLSFRGVPGVIEQSFLIPSANPLEGLRVSFRAWEQNPIDRPINLTLISKLFHDLIDYLPKFLADQKEKLERERAEALDYKGYDRTGIDYWTPKRIQQFPDLTPTILDAAQARLNEIEREETERKLQDEQRQAINEECRHLVDVAAAAWSQPFTVYLIEYGAHSIDGGESIVQEFYSMFEYPQDSGYWLALDRGVSKRQIKPENILSIEKIIVTGEDNVPWNARRYVTIKSKKVEGAEAHVSIPPDEVYPLVEDK